MVIKTWKQISPIAVHPNNTDTVWVANRDDEGYLYHTVDGGLNWTNRYSELYNARGGGSESDTRIKELKYSKGGDTLFIGNDMKGEDILMCLNEGVSWVEWLTIDIGNDTWARYASGNLHPAYGSFFDMTENCDTILASFGYAYVS